jgi:rhamnogalacturonyl hydrolase YesR
MNKYLLLALAVFVLGSSCTAAQSNELLIPVQPDRIRKVMTSAADWQLAHPGKHHTADWTHGALFAGLTAWAQMADEGKYYNALLAFGQKNDWQPHSRKYHADDHAVGQMYLELYKTYKDPRMVSGIQKRFDEILAEQPQTKLEFKSKNSQYRYSWCDALFMAPPVWAKLARITGDKKYLDYMNKEWWATTDYLYDKDEHLYYRDSRYFDQREANGKKIFWSRGNGWVFAGLARVLEELPDDYPDRDRYVELYKQMAAKLAAIQPRDGMWRPSLLDPDSFPVPESSGSGFFCYGLAWGINHGLLDEKTYLPVVIKAWQGLNRNLQPDGKLGYVQPIGGDPQMTKADDTEIYGVGAFLLAGSEVYKIAIRNGAAAKKLVVTNPALTFRDSETVELNFNDIQKAVSGLTKENAAIYDFKTNRLRVTQIVEDGQKTELLFQANLAPGEKKYFWVLKQPAGLEKPVSKYTTYCRFIPERKDDFGWENDKVAFRMYGPALEYETITSGIDAWGKCVPTLVIDKFIKDSTEKQIPYHEDHGEGGDFYKVGPTLGCGGLAPFVDGKVILPRNFVQWKVLANGPIRSMFELTYKPWQAGPVQVSEIKRISIDLCSNMNRIVCTYAGEGVRTLPLAAGIVLRENSDQTWTGDQTIAYWLPTDFITGMMGCGVVFGSQYKTESAKADNHLLLTLSQEVEKPVVYYAGSCWNKNEEFNSFEKWQRYLMNFKARIDHPVIIKLND